MIPQILTEKAKPNIPSILKKQYPNPTIHTRLAEFGIQTLQDAQVFLNPDLYQPTPPNQLPDLNKAANKLWETVQNGKKIGVWGDFDVDGQTSTTLLVEALQKLGADVVYHIPNRERESHGIKIPFLKEFLKNNISLLLTCDTGVSENEAIDFANQNGVEVIVTDHHSLPEKLPEAYAIINPQRVAENHPLRHLAGVGTAYKFIEAVYQLAEREHECEPFLDLVSLGTVADVALLVGENRYLVHKGIQILKKTPRLGLQEIYKIKEIDIQTLNESHISFILAPMLNSLGRLDDANPIVDFFSTTNQQTIKTFATNLNNLNEKRKLLTDQIADAVFDQINRSPKINSYAGIVVHQNYWHPGVLGIVANRVVEQFQKPVILLTGDEKHGLRGSARSTEAVNIIQAIREQKSMLDHFGGHAMAAGLSLPANALEKFRIGLDKSIKQQIGTQSENNIFKFDFELSFKQIQIDFIDQFLSLRPFGAGNPAFLFISKNVMVKKIAKIGKGQQHLRLTLVNETGDLIDVLWWHGNADSLPGEPIDIVYTLSKSTYKGQDLPQIELITFQPSEKTGTHPNKIQQRLSLVDYRINRIPTERLWLDYPDALVWYEGSKKLDIPTISRLTISPAKNLIIAFHPPGIREIRKVFLTCRPQQIILNPQDQINLSLNELIALIGRMLTYAIHHNQGLIQVAKMAAAIGQREKFIITTLEWMAAVGKITLTKHPDTDLLVQIGGTKKPDSSEYFKNQLSYLHKETQAFQHWYQSVDINKLNDELFYLDR